MCKQKFSVNLIELQKCVDAELKEVKRQYVRMNEIKFNALMSIRFTQNCRAEKVLLFQIKSIFLLP